MLFWGFSFLSIAFWARLFDCGLVGGGYDSSPNGLFAFSATAVFNLWKLLAVVDHVLAPTITTVSAVILRNSHFRVPCSHTSSLTMFTLYAQVALSHSLPMSKH